MPGQRAPLSSAPGSPCACSMSSALAGTASQTQQPRRRPPGGWPSRRWPPSHAGPPKSCFRAHRRFALLPATAMSMRACSAGMLNRCRALYMSVSTLAHSASRLLAEASAWAAASRQGPQLTGKSVLKRRGAGLRDSGRDLQFFAVFCLDFRGQDVNKPVDGLGPGQEVLQRRGQAC